MDGKASMEISMANKTDGNGICQNLRCSLFFSIFCAAVVFSSLVAVLVKKVEVTQVVRSRGMAGMAFRYKHRALCAGQRAVKRVLESYIVVFELQLQAQKVQ